MELQMCGMPDRVMNPQDEYSPNKSLEISIVTETSEYDYMDEDYISAMIPWNTEHERGEMAVTLQKIKAHMTRMDGEQAKRPSIRLEWCQIEDACDQQMDRQEW
ncbi:hypothetical protein CTI12_AA608250 [Artemisia annua]|uniref:Uncharacterized protein n=1 Tax=Artemisia annua TaxID=35608 RepID=A0A2U1KF26_ARTAN|nr:hypothetical protein CTI12_AA608250 [Artemisia annua]